VGGDVFDPVFEGVRAVDLVEGGRNGVGGAAVAATRI